ncbi:hypothetical protein ACFO3D_01200 [Virgibacillus kekensis]|uniref:ABC transporter permease n=1 Tax=Virgibacillus kekensis TaxID=202261 RepID=A0ABV9DDK3_9BACI
MTRQFKGLLYFYAANYRHSLSIFYVILAGILLVSLAFAYFLYQTDSNAMAFSLTGPMYIYCSIVGFLTVKEAVPFAIRMGATRKKMYASLGIFFLGLTSAMAVVASIFQEIIMGLISVSGAFTFLHPAQMMENNWYTRILVDISIMFCLMAIMFLLGLLFYRYGLAGGGSVLGVMVVVILGGIAQGWLVEFLVDLFQSFSMTLFLKIFLVGLFAYVLSWMFIRNITTVKVK